MTEKIQPLTHWTWFRMFVIGLAVLVALGPARSQAKPHAGGMLVTPVYPTAGLEVTVANHPPVAMPYFEWQPVAGATAYWLQISDQIGFNTAYNFTIAHTKYLATNVGLLRDTTWYWRVKVQSSPNGEGDWPSPDDQNQPKWRFSRNWAKNNAPTQLSPAAGATIEFFEDPIFSWTPVIGAAQYLVKIDADSDCQSPMTTYTTPYTRFTPNQRLMNANYYWCVVAQDPAGRDGQMSAARPLFVNYAQTTTLLEPANNSFPAYTPQFKWTAVKGANAYQLLYGTDPTFQTWVGAVNVNQTTYTPPNSLPNDKDYYWKVRVYYGGGYVSQDSAVWKFQKRWYHQPIILSPRNNEVVNVQSFTWTPVREAASYTIEGSFDPGFGSSKWSAQTPNTWYWRNEFPSDEWNKTLYLRVRPYDGSGNPGKDSNSISYRPRYDVALVENLYPRYYYSPPSIPTGNYPPPYNIPNSYDYALDVPTLYWSRTYVPGPKPGSPLALPEHVEADYYKLEVNRDVNFLTPADWTYTTQNLSATPDESTPFTPTTDIYYWRVTPYLASGAILTDSATNQPWAVRFDMSRLITPTITSAPVLLRPPFNEKAMDTLPSFEWLPLQGAARYEFAISADINFTSPAYLARTPYTHHTPNVRLPKGTYFWRVRGLDGSGNPVGGWSEARRLIATYQIRWVASWPACAPATVPSTTNTLIATSPATGISTDLTTLYVAQDKDYWYVGFNVSPAAAGTIVYGLYLDGNQTDGSGASVAPPNRPAITTVSYYQPEYAVYVVYSNTQFITVAPKSVALYRWDAIAGAWDPEIKDLLNPLQVGGDFTFDSTVRYAEFKLPKTAIGDAGFTPFVLSPALFSALSNSAVVVSDTLPDNGQNVSVFNEVKSISDRLTLSLPQDNSGGSGAYVKSMPFIYAEAGNLDWLRGTKLQIARDPVFNNLVLETSFTCYGCENYVDVFHHVYTPIRILEDNTLYWRYIVRHFSACLSGEFFSPPTEAHVFVKYGPTPDNLRTEGNYSTPTFRWNDTEGASAYHLQWSQNPDFSGLAGDLTTNHDGFTPQNPLAPGKYYWRVRYENSYASDWSISSTLVITMPQITTTAPAPGAIVSWPPTFKWEPVLTPAGQPTWSAPYYRLQVATSPIGFSSPFESLELDTINWTPNHTYPDGTYYWRVAVLDASRNEGPYSQVYTFTKQYLTPTLTSPLSGAQTGNYPEFEWTAVTGAASYRLMVATNPQFSNPALDITTNNIHFIPTSKLNSGTYYWRVAMIDKDGRPGPFNDAKIIVKPPDDLYPYHVYTPLVRK